MTTLALDITIPGAVAIVAAVIIGLVFAGLFVCNALDNNPGRIDR